MKNKTLQFTKGLVEIVFVGLVIASILLILLIALSPFIINKTSAFITATVPVSIGEGEESRLYVEIQNASRYGIYRAFIDGAQGRLRLETTNWYQIFVGSLSQLIAAIGLAYAFYQLRNILRDMSKDRVFTVSNRDRLSRLGLTFLFLSFVRPLVELIAANEVLKHFIEIDPSLNLPEAFNTEIALLSLFIMIIAKVWSRGLELQEEQDLTI